jgi:hypothetical protein
MCELCGDPTCVVNFFHPDGHQILLDEWKELVGTIAQSQWWDWARVAHTVIDRPPLNIVTQWVGVTKDEKPPQVWATTVLARSLPLPMLIEGIFGLGELKEAFDELGIKSDELSNPIPVGDQIRYATREAAAAGHDQMVAKIHDLWSELHQQHGVPEQLTLGGTDLSEHEFDLELPGIEQLLRHDPPPSK